MQQVFWTQQHLGLALDAPLGPSLAGFVIRHGHLSGQQARWFFQQIVIALDFCHALVRRAHFKTAGREACQVLWV